LTNAANMLLRAFEADLGEQGDSQAPAHAEQGAATRNARRHKKAEARCSTISQNTNETGRTAPELLISGD
jgi:hypothetical protein